MIDIYTDVITYLANTLRAKDGAKYTSAVFTNNTKNIDETRNITVYIKQLDSPSMAEDLEADSENAILNAFEIHTYTLKTKDQSYTFNYGVSKEVGDLMIVKGFKKIYGIQEMNDVTPYHSVARYRRVICDSDVDKLF